jgi:hypothetical protein
MQIKEYIKSENSFQRIPLYQFSAQALLYVR